MALVFAATAGAACGAAHVPGSTRLLGLLVAATWLLRVSAVAYAMALVCIAYFSFWFAYQVPAFPLRRPGDYILWTDFRPGR